MDDNNTPATTPTSDTPPAAPNTPWTPDPSTPPAGDPGTPPAPAPGGDEPTTPPPSGDPTAPPPVVSSM